jgi:hypothetical protein
MNSACLYMIAESFQELKLSSEIIHFDLPMCRGQQLKKTQDTLLACNAYLHLDHIFGASDGPNYDVYMNSSNNETPSAHYIGSLGFYGNRPKNSSICEGMHLMLNISEQLSYLRCLDSWSEQNIILTLHPQWLMEVAITVNIGHIYLYYQDS